MPQRRAQARDSWLGSEGHSPGLTWPLGPHSHPCPCGLGPRPARSLLSTSWAARPRPTCVGPRSAFPGRPVLPVVFSLGPHPGDGVHHDLTWTLARSGVGGTRSRSSLPEQSGLGPCVRGRGPHEHTLLWRSKARDSGRGSPGTAPPSHEPREGKRWASVAGMPLLRVSGVREPPRVARAGIL